MQRLRIAVITLLEAGGRNGEAVFERLRSDVLNGVEGKPLPENSSRSRMRRRSPTVTSNSRSPRRSPTVVSSCSANRFIVKSADSFAADRFLFGLRGRYGSYSGSFSRRRERFVSFLNGWPCASSQSRMRRWTALASAMISARCASSIIDSHRLLMSFAMR